MNWRAGAIWQKAALATHQSILSFASSANFFHADNSERSMAANSAGVLKPTPAQIRYRLSTAAVGNTGWPLR